MRREGKKVGGADHATLHPLARPMLLFPVQSLHSCALTPPYFLGSRFCLGGVKRIEFTRG